MTIDEIGKMISNNIKAERVRKNLTQEDMALKLNVTRQTYTTYENNAINIKIETLYNISSILECNIDIFFIQ